MAADFGRGGFPIEFAGCVLRVLGDVHEHRAGTVGSGDLKCFAQARGDFLGARHQIIVLGDRQRDAGDVGFLKRVGADQLLPTWPVMQTIGEESIMAVAMPVTMFVAPGPEVAMATPTLPLARA